MSSASRKMAEAPFKLSCAIYGHKGDVRSVTATEDGKIVSGSRDMTAKLWTPNESGCGYREYLTLSSHKSFVSCVCAFPPSEKFSNGLIITGSNDKAIRLFDGIQSNPIKVLSGHTNTVCKIVLGANENTILSSSWDQTAKLWDITSCKVIAMFSGHQAAVWSSIQLPCGLVVTGSADRQIKVWTKNGSCQNTLYGHTDCVRDLALAGPNEILSCSNDTTIRLWNVESGQCLNTFHGHDSMSFLSSSEDGTVKLWVNGEVAESIQIPASSIWSVATMPNGDIVTGSSDGVIRVFSTDVSRQASLEELTAYEEKISNSQKIEGLNVAELPGEEALRENGIKDGQTKIVKVGNKVLAYNWSMAECKWNLIGNVTGSAETGETKPKYKGKEYDYVFSVDIEPGKPLLKLPYNKTDDPWQAAQNFIHENQLNQNFLEEVVNFIIKNSNYSKGRTRNDDVEYVDPFTGIGRYIPGMRHAPDGVRDSDPGTMAGASVHQSQKGETPNIPSCYFPQREFLRFDQANVNLILAKLLEFNNATTGNGKQVVSDDQIERLVKMCESGASCGSEDIDTLYRLLDWPEEIVFPVLDVMRLAIRNSEANDLLCNDKLIPRLMNYLSPDSTVTSNVMLALRVLVNMISGEAGLTLAHKNKSKLLGIIENVPSSQNKSVQVAMSTLLLNLSVMLRRSETSDGRSEALSVTGNVLPKLTDQEALFRSLVALGTLLVDAIDAKNYSSAFESILLKHQNDSSCGPKIQQCCQHILQMLR